MRFQEHTYLWMDVATRSTRYLVGGAEGKARSDAGGDGVLTGETIDESDPGPPIWRAGGPPV